MGVTIESGVIVATFKRTVQPKQFEPATAEAYLAIKASDNPDEWATQMTNAFGLVKSVVLDQQGLDFEIVDGIVTEVGISEAQAIQNVTEAFATTTPASSSADDGDASPPFPVPQNPDDRRSQPKHEKDANAAWAKQRFSTHPLEFWDNRGNKTNPKGPDIKHRTTGLGAWL